MAVTQIRGNTQIINGTIENGQIHASAAIVYSKLSLSDSIVNADINSAAAIVYSKLSLSDSIVNADINSAAAIARTKLASGTAYRILANNDSGVMSDAAAITASRALISDANGIPTHSAVTNTELGYVNGVTSAIQTQIDGKLTKTLVDGKIFIGNVSNEAAAQTMSGDVTIDNAGVASISSGVIVNADIKSDAAIATSKLADASKFLLNDANRTIGNGVRYSYGSSQTFSGSYDLITKEYADTLAAGLIVKESVRLATAAALPSYTPSGSGVGKTLTADANGALTVDGVAVATSDRILVKSEGASHIDHGIYTVTQTGDGDNPWILTRATDFDGSPAGEVKAGDFTFAAEGSANADTGWVLTTNNPITVDTTALAFTQFSQAGVIDAGNGLQKSGTTISVKPDTATDGYATISATVDGTRVVSVKNGNVAADAAIVYSKLSLSDSIVNADINSAAAIVYSKLSLSDSIVNADINSAAAIARTKLASGTAYRILANNDSGVMSENAAITGSKAVASDANGQLVASATTATELGYVNGVTSAIQTQIDGKLTKSLTSANIFVGNGSNVATGVAMSGDIAIDNAGVTSIASGVIVNDDVKSDAAIAFSKLAALTSGNILVGNVSNVAASVAMSGDGTLSNAGVLTLASTVLKEADIVTREVPSGTINGENVTFTLANTPVSGTEHIYLNGILQNEGVSNDYTISGATITFNSAPQTGDVLLASYWK